MDGTLQSSRVVFRKLTPEPPQHFGIANKVSKIREKRSSLAGRILLDTGTVLETGTQVQERHY
jgi:hypothetical protein